MTDKPTFDHICNRIVRHLESAPLPVSTFDLIVLNDDTRGAQLEHIEALLNARRIEVTEVRSGTVWVQAVTK